jgi:DNA-binding response OmpR family regulator
MRILIAEDDAVLGMVAAAALEAAGHQVAGPAFSALDACALAGGCGAELALVDINLEGNDEGIALARTLRERFALPSLFVSGQVAVAREHREAALGLLPKPYDIDDLVAAVAWAGRVLGGAGTYAAGKPASLELFGGTSSGTSSERNGA